MNWTTFSKTIVKMFGILSIIRETATEQGIHFESVFSALNEKNAREALKTATEMFAAEIKRLDDGPEYEVLVSPASMSIKNAMTWADSMDEGWGFPTSTNFHINFNKALRTHGELSDGKRYWTERTDIRREAGHRYFGACSNSYGGIEIGNCCDRNDIYAVFVRELPPKKWQLV